LVYFFLVDEAGHGCCREEDRLGNEKMKVFYRMKAPCSEMEVEVMTVQRGPQEAHSRK
jgi:hypothetical protein